MSKHLNKALLYPFLLLLGILPILSCDSLFKPKTMTIEYDEEVKLHDGEMIWVHITRHYYYTSEPATGGAYMPSTVEISWDTGFEGVGRKSVYFDSYVGIIDKYNGNWYVIGNKNNSTKSSIDDSVNCNLIGILVGQLRCIAIVNEHGELVKVELNELENINKKNIIYPLDIKDWGMLPKPLNNTELSWNKKLSLQSFQPKRRQTLGQPLIKNGEIK